MPIFRRQRAHPVARSSEQCIRSGPRPPKTRLSIGHPVGLMDIDGSPYMRCMHFSGSLCLNCLFFHKILPTSTKPLATQTAPPRSAQICATSAHTSQAMIEELEHHGSCKERGGEPWCGHPAGSERDVIFVFVSSRGWMVEFDGHRIDDHRKFRI